MKPVEMFRNETNSGARVKLVAIADDLTGAFDTGVQFSKRGAEVKVVTGAELTQDCLQADVLVIDAETRHLGPDETYDVTFRLAEWAREKGAERFYVKTDSGLRGHIGAALKAVMDVSGAGMAAFAPAYPDMKRITRGGMQWIDGIPLAESVFGQDLFDPVQTSSIRGMIESYGLAVRTYMRGETLETKADRPTVAIFDAETNGDLRRIAAQLQEKDCLAVTAGCAAFAAALTTALRLPNALHMAPAVHAPLLVLCGSLNPITLRQIAYGERMGGHRVTLSTRQLLEADYLSSQDGLAWLEELRNILERGETLLIDTGASQPEPCQDHPGNREETRRRISQRLGCLLERLLDMEEAAIYTPMIIGGDTLMGYLARRPSLDLTLEGEVAVGVAAFRLRDGEKTRLLLSKSGGFGSPTLLDDVLNVHDEVAR